MSATRAAQQVCMRALHRLYAPPEPLGCLCAGTVSLTHKPLKCCVLPIMCSVPKTRCCGQAGLCLRACLPISLHALASLWSRRGNPLHFQTWLFALCHTLVQYLSREISHLPLALSVRALLQCWASSRTSTSSWASPQTARSRGKTGVMRASSSQPQSSP